MWSKKPEAVFENETSPQLAMGRFHFIREGFEKIRKPPTDELQLTGLSPGRYAANFAKFVSGSRMVRSQNRPATEPNVQGMSLLIFPVKRKRKCLTMIISSSTLRARVWH